MSAKLSQTTLLGKLYSDKVVAAMEATDHVKAAEALNALYGEVLEEGETMPDWMFLFQLDARLIAALSRRAETGDQGRRDAVAAQVQLTRERDQKRAILNGVLRNAQRRVRLAYGKDALRPLGLGAGFSRRPEALVAEAVTARGRCLTPELRPRSLQPGARPIDWTDLAAEIEEASTDLAECIAHRQAQQEAAVQALLEKHDGQDGQHLGRTYVVQRVESTYRMSGLKEEADRLRLTLRARPERGGDDPEDGSQEVREDDGSQGPADLP